MNSRNVLSKEIALSGEKDWLCVQASHNAWAFYWLLLSLYLSGLRWLEVPSHTQLASFIKLLVNLFLKFKIWRKKIRGWSSWRIPWMVGSFSSYDRQVISLTTSSSAIFMRPAAAGKDTQFFKWKDDIIHKNFNKSILCVALKL